MDLRLYLIRHSFSDWSVVWARSEEEAVEVFLRGDEEMREFIDEVREEQAPTEPRLVL
jgi:hypothetical protein